MRSCGPPAQPNGKTSVYPSFEPDFNFFRSSVVRISLPEVTLTRLIVSSDLRWINAAGPPRCKPVAIMSLPWEGAMKRLLPGLMLAASPAMADPESYGHMMNWGYGHGVTMVLGPALWLIVLGLVVAGVIWFVRRNEAGVAPRSRQAALAELDIRLARGDIEPEEYIARKKLLSS